MAMWRWRIPRAARLRSRSFWMCAKLFRRSRVLAHEHAVEFLPRLVTDAAFDLSVGFEWLLHPPPPFPPTQRVGHRTNVAAAAASEDLDGNEGDGMAGGE